MPLEPMCSHARLPTPQSQALCSQHPYSIPQIKISSSSSLFFQIKFSDQLPPEQSAQLRGKVSRFSCRARAYKYLRPQLQCGSSWLSCSSWHTPEFGHSQEALGAKAENFKSTWLHSMGGELQPGGKNQSQGSSGGENLESNLKTILGGSSEQRETPVPEARKAGSTEQE